MWELPTPISHQQFCFWGEKKGKRIERVKTTGKFSKAENLCSLSAFSLSLSASWLPGPSIIIFCLAASQPQIQTYETRAGSVAQWWNACLSCMRSWGPIPGTGGKKKANPLKINFCPFSWKPEKTLHLFVLALCYLKPFRLISKI